MKNIISIMFLAILLITGAASKGQLPLQFGDAVVTHSQTNYSGGISSGDIVLRTVKSHNTSAASPGQNWNTSFLVPAGSKPANWNAPNWIFSKLGSIFGITLDTKNSPDIYISNSQIYQGAPVNGSKVWRLDGTTGIESLVFNFANTSRSLGNLKYAAIGGTENIYVSNWDKGTIERLTGNSATALPWVSQPPFNPKFGLAADNMSYIPYGLAVRTLSSGGYRLYYSKIITSAPFSSNEIFSVDLDAAGGFLPATETLEITPAIATLQPIADIAFTEDGRSMLVGQQTWYYFGVLSAHNSSVAEFINTGTHSWANSANVYPSGKGGGTNCAGGVSYSNNLLTGNSPDFFCDTTVAFTADYIRYDDPAPYRYVYGMQYMKRGPGNSLSNSIWIDQDDQITTNSDKQQLGDIEVYKKTNTCTPPCVCGSWQSIQYGSNINWWVNGTVPPPLPVISFPQGEAPALPIIPHYNCSGTCSAVYTYQLVGNGRTVNLTANQSGGIVLSNNTAAVMEMRCDIDYLLLITPRCGNSNCPPVRITVKATCPPPCSSCTGQAIVNTEGLPNITNGNAAINFTVSNSIPVTEVRVLIDEFSVYSTVGNENCMLCKNTPRTWGSIQSASLTGTANPALSVAAETDNREVVFKTGSLFTLLPPGNVLLNLALPNTTGLSCCTLKANVCIKFIIRDINCCEKEVVKCFNFNLNQ